MNDETRERSLSKAISDLVEQFDSVLIVVTYNEDGSSFSKVRKAGNYFASKGAVQEWLDDEKSYDSARHIARELNSEDD